MSKDKLPLVEVGFVYEHLDPEKVYVAEQVNPSLEEVYNKTSDATLKNSIIYKEGIGWTKTSIITKDNFDQPTQLQERGFDQNRKDICTHFVLIGEGKTAHVELKEYGATEPILKITVDASGLVIKEDAAE